MSIGKMKRVTVIGAGNGGVAAAYHFSKIGNEVCIYDQPTFDTQIKAIYEKKGITALKEINDTELILSGFQEIKKATTNIKEALEFADILVIIVPSFAQTILFKKMLPYLKASHKLIFMPGNFASLTMEKIKKDLGYHKKKIRYVDAISIPWACRVIKPGEVAIMGMKKFLYAGVFPGRLTNQLVDDLNAVFPIEIKPLENVINAGLENINYGAHPLVTTVNIGLLENFNGNFNYYQDCISPATARASEAMEEERIKLGECLGIKLKSELEMMNLLYGTHEETVYDFNKKSVTHGKIHSAPDSSTDRYITEDIPYLLVPMYEFAKLMDLDLPIIESVIRLASAYNSKDYFKSGRTLSKMGLNFLTKDEILEYVNN